ncbi:Translation initiation factor 1A [Methanosarcina barkeri 227]|uniref:Translation initiation factor 1A n=3 Tax=Methanosarcina barkeri TaxID=2208 RepID=A0A0E3QWU6_METBA|nr:Translation initiation factor 1A [Methanosarcina barkeri MS]AKB56704.1 Translation initiation factor 1A [Methanosarcina barkeri 227]AKJ37285.1 translation initiation factor aeIF-1A [Methanosarcina barkeri CM1]
MWKISKVEIYKDSQEDGKTSRTENKIRESLFKIEILKIKINIGGINLANYRSIIRRRNSKSSKSVAGDTHEVIRVRTPQKDRNEVLATVLNLLGSKRVTLQCMDGVVRMGRIPGSKNKRLWIREGDIVIANPWEIQDSKADVIWKYTRPQIEWLEKKGYLN